MTTTTAMHSNAFNFMSYLQGGVDPRTGQYTVSLSLLDNAVNALQGPDLPLALFFNPLNTLDSGYGLGWNLQLSQYDTQRQVVSVHTGATFKYVGKAGARMLLPEQKIDDFRLFDDGGGYYRIAHRSGLVERLQVQSGTSLALPVEVYGEKGHVLKLAYAQFRDAQNDLHYRLQSITDHQGQRVFTLERKNAANGREQIDIQLNPDRNGTAQATYQLLINRIKQVDEVVLPTADKASWRYAYKEIKTPVGNGPQTDTFYCIDDVHTPTGAHETVEYSTGVSDKEHHQVPGNPVRRVPRVLTHSVDPGSGPGAVMKAQYSYALSADATGYRAGHNFLGNNLTHERKDDLDYLFGTRERYTYGSIETRSKDGEKHEVERRFNRFHLLEEERNTHTDTQTRVTSTDTTVTQYYSRGGYFEADYAYCQLPGTTTRTWKRNVGQPYSEAVVREYYENATLKSELQATGIKVINTWYPTEGAGTDQKDPNYFTPRLESTTTVPDSAAQQPGAPTLYRHYRYEVATALAGAGPKTWHRVTHDTLHLDNAQGAELQVTQYGYFDTPAQFQTHGRLETETVTLNGKATITSYCYDCEEKSGKRVTAPVEFPAHIKALYGRITPLRRKLLVNEPVLTTFQTVTGWDHKEGGSPEESRQKSMTLTRSLLTGEPVLFEDNNGVRILTQYDELHRITDEIVAPDEDEFRATRHYDYTLCGANNSETKQIMTNVRGIITTTYVDGLGRPVRECRSHIDENQLSESKETVSISYNTFGQKISETLIDYLPQMPTDDTPTPPPIALPLTRTFAYNSWGEECCVTGADGVQQHKFIEPTGSSAHKGHIEKAWRQGTGGASNVSGKTESWLNAFGKPVKNQRLLANGEPYAEQNYEYDGLGNCKLQTDERSHSIRFDFDAWDRVTQTTLADGTQVTRDYAEHTRKELPVAIHTGNPGTLNRPLGSQTFDGLDRLESKTTGNRTEQLFYPAGMTRPHRHISAKGDTISFDYDLQLTDAPKLTKAPEGDAEFTYNKTSARLEKAINQHGTRTYEYDWNNRATLERWSDNRDKPLYTIRQGISLHGRLCWQKTENGPDSTFTYDEHGRPKKTTQGNLESNFHYDTLGQMERVELVDLQTQEKLTTTFTYDDQGREKKRTFKRGAQPERSITQNWALENLLELRHLEEGKTSLLEEAFTYDERGRLLTHLCSGRDLPRNEQDQEYISQAFTYDELDNILSRTTTLKNQTVHTATFKYEEQDPCQLSRIIYSPARPDTPARFDYDTNGCQLNDEKGRSMSYDSEKRLLQVSKTAKSPGGTYHYDAHGHLIRTKQAQGTNDTLLYFEKNRLRLAIRGEIQTHLLHAGGLPLGQQQAGDTAATHMFSCTASGSVIADSLESTKRHPGYSAYGQRFGALASLLGFNGEYLDPDSGWYLLGRGHRAYNPELMRFHAPDTLSPFGNGGINCYAYCQGNPITFSDPTGRASRGLAERDERGLAERGKRGLELTPEQIWMHQQQQQGGSGVWIALGVGILFTALAIVATVVTLGAAAPATVAAASSTVASVSAAVSAGTVAGAAAALGAASTVVISVAPQLVLAGMAVAGAIFQTASFVVETAANFTQNPDLAKAAMIVGYLSMALALSDNISGLAIQRIGQAERPKPAGSGLGSQSHDQTSGRTTQSGTDIRM